MDDILYDHNTSRTVFMTSPSTIVSTEPTYLWVNAYPLISGVIIWALIILFAILCRQCCVCMRNRCYVLRSCLSRTPPLSRCCSPPPVINDSSDAGTDSTIHDDLPPYDVAIRMPKPEDLRLNHLHHSDEETSAGESSPSPSISQYRDNSNQIRDNNRHIRETFGHFRDTDPGPSRRIESSVSLGPPPAYSNDGCIFPDEDESVDEPSPGERSMRLEFSRGQSVVSSESTSQLPSYEDALITLNETVSEQHTDARPIDL